MGGMLRLSFVLCIVCWGTTYRRWGNRATLCMDRAMMLVTSSVYWSVVLAHGCHWTFISWASYGYFNVVGCFPSGLYPCSITPSGSSLATYRYWRENLWWACSSDWNARKNKPAQLIQVSLVILNLNLLFGQWQHVSRLWYRVPHPSRMIPLVSSQRAMPRTRAKCDYQLWSPDGRTMPWSDPRGKRGLADCWYHAEDWSWRYCCILGL